MKIPYNELYEAYLIASQERYKYKEVLDKIIDIVYKNDYEKYELQLTTDYKIHRIAQILEEIK